MSDDVVNRALHASALELESECNWLWAEQLTALFTLDDEANFIDLPATVGSVTAVSLLRGEQLDPLQQLTIAPVRQAAIGAVGGDPTFWALADRRIYFDCSLVLGTEFELVITAATPEMLEDAIESANPTIQRHQQAVIANACSYLALSYMKNGEEAQRQRAVYERIRDRMIDAEAQRRGGGVQPDTWGNSNRA